MRKINIFVGGPFSAALKDDEFDPDLRKTFELVFRKLQSTFVCDLLSSHLAEKWGKEVNEEALVKRDNDWVEEAHAYVGVLPFDPTSGLPWRTEGTCIEIGIALALGKPILLLMEKSISILILSILLLE